MKAILIYLRFFPVWFRLWLRLVAGALLLFAGASFSSPPHRGERPPIPLENVSPDAYETGVFRVKFVPEATRQLDQALTRKSSDGIMRTGLAAFDSLSEQHHLAQARPMLDILYEISPASLKYRDRHREWGFHLWYEFRTPLKTDIPMLLEMYNSLSEVELAEPVYKIRRIGAVDEAVRIDEAVRTVTGSTQVVGYQQSSTWAPNDPEYSGRQWAFNNTGQVIFGQSGTVGADISMPEAWAMNKGNPAVIVAVIDGGVKYDHPDIAANMWPGVGYNFVDESPVITFDNHGTHVAGTIAAVSNNATGVAGIAGGDGSGNGVRIMSCQVFSSSGSGGFAMSFVWAADNGAAITQNSWGYEVPGVYEEAVLTGIDYFNANGGGGVLNGGISIFAAGNDNSDDQWYPACYSGAFAVASTDNCDVRSSFSNYGTWIDVSAPGTGIYSTGATSPYYYSSGTSMACPHVSGVAALIASLAPGIYTGQQVAGIIRNTSDNHYDKNLPSFAGLLGTGRLNAYTALQYVAGTLEEVRNPMVLQANEVSNFQINLSWQKNISNNPVMLAWSSSGVFGIPLTGVSYSPGQILPGGGTVIYAGNNTTFSHTGLVPATKYYYKAWSYNPSLEYSSGITISAITECMSQQLPLNEDFVAGQVPPECWIAVDNDQDGFNWKPGEAGEGYSPQSGSFAAVSASYASGEGALTPDNWLISPRLDLPAGTVDIRYWVKAQDPAFPAETYSVLVSSTNKNPGSFAQLFTETLTNNVWQERSVELEGMAGQAVYIAFRHFGSTDQFELVLDNIRIEEVEQPVFFTIQASAGPGGSISPSGNVVVPTGQDQAFDIVPLPGYHNTDVFIDNVSVGPGTSFVMSNVTADHSIHAEFAIDNFMITATAGTGGSISPQGAVSVNYGQGQSFSITALTGYVIDDVLVNGSSMGPISSYTFNNVTANHTIHAVFKPLTYTISPTATSGGTITPSGQVIVNHGDSQQFFISANEGYYIDYVLVNGTKVGPVSVYSFSGVTASHTIHAVFTPLTYTIAATASQGGTIAPSGNISISHGESRIFFIQPGIGYEVADVVVDGQSLGPIGVYVFSNVSSNHSIYVEFSIQSFVLMASASPGGSVTPSGTIFADYGTGQTFIMQADEGYHIADVVIDGESAGQASAHTFDFITGNHTIEALFAINNYTLTAMAGAGGSISTAGTQAVEHGSTVTYTITADAGYHISDVLVDGESVGAAGQWVFAAVGSDHTIEALFAINNYTLTATAGAGGIISPAGALVVTHGSTVTYNITADIGYHISDVLVDGESVGAAGQWVFSTVSGDHTIEALFTINNYTLTATAGAGGSISPAGSLVVEHGSTVTYTITADIGYHIFDVVVDDESVGAASQWVFAAVDSDHSIEALFGINTYTLTATTGAGGSISPAGELVVEHGSTATYTIAADAGYHIADVLVDEESVGVTDQWVFAGVDSDHTIEARFSINTYTLTATVGAGGSISSEGALIVEHGSTVTYTIAADTGYHISDVLVDQESVGATEQWVFAVVESDHTIEALFDINTYTLTATAGAGGNISPSGVLVVDYESTVTYAITADEGYHIADVLVDEESVGVTDQWVFARVVGDHTIEALFEKDPDPLYDVEFFVVMDYAENFEPSRDALYITGSMFAWEGKGIWMNSKQSASTQSPIHFVSLIQLPAGSYEYTYYLNDFPGGAEWNAPPYRTLTVPDTLKVTDFFGYRTDPTTTSPEVPPAGLTIYPNPARGQVAIVCGQEMQSLRVIDVNGRIRYEATPHQREFVIDSAGLPNGVYFVQVSTSNRVLSTTLIVNN